MAANNNKAASFTILQWNSQSIVGKSIAFEELLFESKVHIAVVSETWLCEEQYLKIRDYKIYRQDRTDGYGGISIFVHRSIKSRKVQSLSTNPGIEFLRIEIFNCETIKIVIAIYCPSSVRTNQSDWESILSICSHKSLILGDFNAHHNSSSCKTDCRGNQINNSLMDSNFVTLNNGNYTWMRLSNSTLQKSSPDISLASSDIAHKFDWMVLNETLGSDHLIIKLKISLSPNISPFHIKRNYKRADWQSRRSTIAI
jgi:hypothetical protein